jgi:hypothetical protein
MGLFSTYCYNILVEEFLSIDTVTKGLAGDTADSPYRYILYGAFILAFAYLIVSSQTRLLLKTRKLLKEKELSLLLIEEQKRELELREKILRKALFMLSAFRRLYCLQKSISETTLIILLYSLNPRILLVVISTGLGKKIIRYLS